MEQGQVLSSGDYRVGLTAEEVRARFVHAPPPGIRGDDIKPEGDHRVRASVLVPLLVRPAGLHVLLTQRTPHLSRHAGQVAFPGGRMEESDADAVITALRETEEEVGLSRKHVEVIGRLDLFNTGTGFAITPVVGLIAAAPPLSPDPHEVAEAFEVPLDYILNPVNREQHTGERLGRMRTYFVFPYQGRNIWGATAAMLVNLADILNS